MKKFIGKVEAFNLFMAGEEGVSVLDNTDENLISFCDLEMDDYRNNMNLQYLIDDKSSNDNETVI